MQCEIATAPEGNTDRSSAFCGRGNSQRSSREQEQAGFSQPQAVSGRRTASVLGSMCGLSGESNLVPHTCKASTLHLALPSPYTKPSHRTTHLPGDKVPGKLGGHPVLQLGVIQKSTTFCSNLARNVVFPQITDKFIFDSLCDLHCPSECIYHLWGDKSLYAPVRRFPDGLRAVAKSTLSTGSTTSRAGGESRSNPRTHVAPLPGCGCKRPAASRPCSHAFLSKWSKISFFFLVASCQELIFHHSMKANKQFSP